MLSALLSSSHGVTCSHPRNGSAFWFGRDGPLAVSHPTLQALRARLAWESAQLMLLGASAAGDGELLDLGDGVCPIFQAAFRAGGARGLLDLLERAYIFQHSTAVFQRMGMEGVVSLAHRPAYGLEYELPPLPPSPDEKRRAAALNSTAKGTRDVGPQANRYGIQGGLWWLRHWAGEWLASQAARDNIDPAALVWWTQEQQKCGHSDFITVAVEHAIVWYQIAMSSHAFTSGEYPGETLALWCHEYATGGRFSTGLHTDLGRECRHAFGHAVYYWLALGTHQPARRRRYTQCHTMRTVGTAALQLDDASMHDGIHTCQAAPGKAAIEDCMNGLFHSYDWISPRPNTSALVSYKAKKGTFMGTPHGELPKALAVLAASSPGSTKSSNRVEYVAR